MCTRLCARYCKRWTINWFLFWYCMQQDLTSYGFRGEALSSLCSVADVSIITRTASETAATKLEFDHMGRITARSTVPRAVGTTVSARSMFSRLPVR